MSKKNNSQDEKIEEMLHRALGRYQELLFQAANVKKDESLYGYQQRFFKTMQAGANTVRAAAQSIVQSYIPNVDEPLSALLQSFGARYGGAEIKLTTYVRMVDMLTGSVEQYRLRIDEQIRDRERQGKVTTVMDLQDIINQDLLDDKVTVVRYANGTSVPVDKYAAMLARTTRAETENLSMIQQALREGIDLVECDIVSPTCDSCAVYQGRVYSISGNDSRYPALYKTAFKSGYSIIHPNCRHSWSPYHTELYSEEEKRQTLERSNRSWQPDGDGRRFQQTETLRTQYAAGQQKMRQWNAEILEYERMKDHYKKIGQPPPYSTLGAFRREARKPREQQSVAMQQWKNRERDAREYEAVKRLFGEKAPETFDKFKGMKYNKEQSEEYHIMHVAVLDDRIRKQLGSSRYPLTIQGDKQGKHIIGHKNFIENRSYLAVNSVEDGQAFADYLVKKYSGTGRLVRDKNNKWVHKEIIETEEVIGFVKDNEGNWQVTRRATIHYSKNGTHVVPA